MNLVYMILLNILFAVGLIVLCTMKVRKYKPVQRIIITIVGLSMIAGSVYGLSFLLPGNT